MVVAPLCALLHVEIALYWAWGGIVQSRARPIWPNARKGTESWPHCRGAPSTSKVGSCFYAMVLDNLASRSGLSVFAVTSLRWCKRRRDKDAELVWRRAVEASRRHLSLAPAMAAAADTRRGEEKRGDLSRDPGRTRNTSWPSRTGCRRGHRYSLERQMGVQLRAVHM